MLERNYFDSRAGII